jgi:hypothetical protein
MVKFSSVAYQSLYKESRGFYDCSVACVRFVTTHIMAVRCKHQTFSYSKHRTNTHHLLCEHSKGLNSCSVSDDEAGCGYMITFL